MTDRPPSVPILGRLQSWHLPLRALGCLAGEVVLHNARPGDVAGVGPVHLITRSGKTWRRWEAKKPLPAATFAGCTGRVVHLQDKACWLASGIPEGTREGFVLLSLASGRALERESDNHALGGAALLTDLGPLVAWAPHAHQVRICWSTRPAIAELPVNTGVAAYRQTFWGNRPLGS